MSYYTFRAKSIITFFLLNESIIGMDVKEFKENSPRWLVKIPEGVFAFVPNPLPTVDFKLDSAIIKKLSEADHALGELDGVGTTIPNPHFLIGPLSKREAILSSKLEGIITTAEELIIYDVQGEKDFSKDETREVSNYIKALEYGINRLKELPMSNRLTCEIHQKLMEGVRGKDYNPGEFRKLQNYIGSKGQQIIDARFVPPPVPDMTAALNQLELFYHVQDELPYLIKLALIHYQFETIHPFMDGNGRIGRLLITLLLCSWKRLNNPYLYMSSYFERYKEEYRELLLKVSQKGAWNEWLGFFLTGVSIQSRDAINRSLRLIALKELYRQRIKTKRTSALQLKLIDELFLSPSITISRAAEVMNITYMAAQNNINKLVEVGILREFTGRQRDRIYIAPDIVDVINKDRFDD